MDLHRVNFYRIPDPIIDSSPLHPDDSEPMLLNSEEYKIENLCNPNNDIFLKLEPPETNEESQLNLPTLAKKPKLSQSMPTLKFKKLHLKKDLVDLSESIFPNIWPKCKYDIDIHQTQIEIICNIPSFKFEESIIMTSVLDLIDNIPKQEEAIKHVLENVYNTHDPLLLVDYRNDLIQLYLDYIDDVDISDLVFIPLVKLLQFVSRFFGSNFSTRDVSYLCMYASENVLPQYRDFFYDLSDCLNCDFIDDGLRSILIESFKKYHDRNVLFIRWALMNMDKSQIYSSDDFEPTYTLNLLQLQYDMTSIVERTIPDQQKILKNIFESAAKAETVLNTVANHEVVSSWQTYFHTTHVLYKQLYIDYSPSKISQAGSLFGKSLSALTKFGPISCKLHAELPDLIANIVYNVSIIDEYIAHNRTGFILHKNLITAVAESINKLNEYELSLQEPADSAMCSVLFWNLVKVHSLITHPNITEQNIHSIGAFFSLFSQGATHFVASIAEVTAFQLSNVNASLNNVQLAFIEADSSLHNLASACIRAERRFKDTSQKQFARRWSNYVSSLSANVRNLFGETSAENCITKLREVFGVLKQLKPDVSFLAIENEFQIAHAAINGLNAVLHTVR